MPEAPKHISVPESPATPETAEPVVNPPHLPIPVGPPGAVHFPADGGVK